jgi:branched-chain amino acid transport system permease protein
VNASPAPTPVQAARLAERARRGRQATPYLRGLAATTFLLLPLAAPSFQLLDLAAKIALFGTLAASYDLLIGYTGTVSFGHGMFFGFGAYAVALALGKLGAPTYAHLALGLASGVVVAAPVALLVGLFSLRVKALFFAMITLACAEFAQILAIQWSAFTGGEDGLSPKLPGVLAPGYAAGRLLGVPLTGRVVTYYVVLIGCLLLFGLMRRLVHAEALGFRTFVFQSIASAFGSVAATVVGGGYALWVGYVNPESALSLQLMLDVLLMVIIGGMGTLYGGVIGAGVLVTARTFLPDLRALGAGLGGSAVWGGDWLLYFGILFILVVVFFPKGVLGTLREGAARRRGPAA